MGFKNIIRKLQGQSELKRKIILWAAMGVIGAGLLAWWVGSVKSTLERKENPSLGEQLKVHELQEQLNTIPVKFDGDQQ